MRTVEDQLKAARSLDLQFLIESTMIDQTPEYTKLQRDQMLHGLNSEGKAIGEYASEKYADMKYEMNDLAGFGNVDLRLKQDFYNDIIVDVRSDSFIVTSLDSKTTILEKKYGKNVPLFGLASERNQKFVEFVQPIFIGNVSKALSK